MYEVSGHDMDLYFFRGRKDVQRCEACGELLVKWDEVLESVPISKFRKHDVGTSYDGVQIFSRRTKTVYEQAKMTGLKFIPLAHPELFAVQATTIVHYDSVRRGTQFEKLCNVCGRYRSIIGANPVYLKPGTSVSALGFARTDLEFASGDEKSPLLICGDEAATILRAAKLKGLELRKVTS